MTGPASVERDDEDALREAPLPRMDPFTERRIRAAVMRGEAAPRARLPRWPMALGALAAAAAAIAIVFATRSPVAVTVANTASSGPDVEIVEEPGAQFDRASVGATDLIRLHAGSVRIGVRRHAPGRSLVVVTPDGEIVDEGTVFEVEVSATRTLRVAVVEGAVSFRRTGAPPVHLAAGQVFTAEPEVAGAAASAPTATTGTATTTVPVPTVPASAPRPVGVRAAATSGASADPSGARDADAVAEDAAYLHILALLHDDRGDEAKRAARDFLQRFPHAFRRVEIEGIAR